MDRGCGPGWFRYLGDVERVLRDYALAPARGVVMAGRGQSLDNGRSEPSALRWAVGVVFSVAASVFLGLSLLFLYRVAGWEVLLVLAFLAALLTVIGLAARHLKSRGEVRTTYARAAEETETSPVVIEVPEGTKVDVSPEEHRLTVTDGIRFLPRTALWAVAAVGAGLSLIALSVWAARSTAFDPGTIGTLGLALVSVAAIRAVASLVREWLQARATRDIASKLRGHTRINVGGVNVDIHTRERAPDDTGEAPESEGRSNSGA
jgi:hypothetical protein